MLIETFEPVFKAMLMEKNKPGGGKGAGITAGDLKSFAVVLICGEASLGGNGPAGFEEFGDGGFRFGFVCRNRTEEGPEESEDRDDGAKSATGQHEIAP